jgi:formate dehydrogenase assembly factor FdhD
VEVCVEDSINLLVNGTREAGITISPNDLEAYAYGYLVFEGSGKLGLVPSIPWIKL